MGFPPLYLTSGFVNEIPDGRSFKVLYIFSIIKVS